MKLFEVLVRSVMSYGADNWGWRERKELEKVQEKNLRRCLKVDGATPAHVVRREMGVNKIVVKADTRAVKFKKKLREMQGGLRIECVRLIDLKRRDTKTKRGRGSNFWRVEVGQHRNGRGGKKG